MKKKVASLIFLGILVVNAFGQMPKVKNDPTYDDRPIHFGFTLGLNTMDYAISPTQFYNRPVLDSTIADVLSPQLGFHVQMVSSFKLTEYLTFRVLPGLSFGQRNIYFFDMNGTDDHTMEIESSYIEIPTLLKYRSRRVNNYGLYLISGVNFRYDIAAKRDFPEDKEIYIKTQPFDIAFEAGVGIDFYLPYFKFSTELKLSAGIFDILKHEPHDDFPEYVNSVNRMKSNLFMLSFHFE